MDPPPPPPALKKEWSVNTRQAFEEFSQKNDSSEAREQARSLLTGSATKPKEERDRIKQLVRQGNISEMGKQLFRSASSGDLDLPLTLKVVGTWKGEISIAPTSTVAQVKERVARASGADETNLRLIFAGMSLDSALTMEEAGLKHKTKIMVMESAPASAPSPASAVVPNATPARCAGGCGFFAASGAPGGFCSVCFKKSPLANAPKPPPQTEAAPPATAAVPALSALDKAKTRNAKNRCGLRGCKKKLSLLPPCKCGINYCKVHRHAEAHKCGYDWKKLGKKSIAQENPEVQFSKLNRI